MQVIILAAGMGKRLAELTKDHTKCMVKVNSVPLIDRVIGSLLQVGLTDIIIVTGYKGDIIKQYINDTYKNLNIRFIDNPIYDKTNNIYSLFLCKEEMQKDDSLIIESDLIFDTAILERIIDNRWPNIAVVDKYQDWMDGTVITRDQNDNITSFIPKKKFKEEEKESYWKTVNIYKFSKDFSKNKYLPFMKTYMDVFGMN